MHVWIGIYRALLAIVPHDLRLRYGAAMLDDFTRELAERGTAGAGSQFAFAFAAYVDVFAIALDSSTANFRRDLTSTWRTCRTSPGFTVAIVGTLALAIGANIAVFGVTRAIVFAPLPYPNADRIVVLQGLKDGKPFGFSLPDFADVHGRSTTLAAAGASVAFDIDHVVDVDGTPHRISVTGVTPGFFHVFGLRPYLGRYFTAADARKGSAPALVVSERFWRARMHANPAVVGSIVRLEETAYRVIGIAPALLSPPGVAIADHDAWSVFSEGDRSESNNRGAHYYDAIALLRPGATLEAAGADVRTTFAALRARYPATDLQYGAGVESLLDDTVGNIRPTLLAVFAAVAGVLLIACANVANLLLGRAGVREREFVVRLALGASRRRIVVQMLTETFVFACISGVAGIGLAYVALGAFVNAHPRFVPRVEDVRIEGWTIAFAAAVVVASTLFAGLAPALTISRRRVGEVLRSAGRSGDASRGARGRAALVVFEIALTLALTIVAGLIVRSYGSLTSRPLGFDERNVSVVGPVELSAARYQTDAGRIAYFERTLSDARSVPGVAEASWAFDAPFIGDRWNQNFTIDGIPNSVGNTPTTRINTIGNRYFATLGMPLESGRTFSDHDRNGSLPVAIVNGAFERKFLHGRRAVGTRTSLGTIVGVVRDARNTFGDETPPTIFQPIDQSPPYLAYLVVRSDAGVPANDAILAAVTRADARLVPPEIAPLRARIDASAARSRLTMQTLSLLAIVALALALTGVFAVVSYGVSQRTREFGIRIALGATTDLILRDVLLRAMRLSIAGIAAGVAIAAFATRSLGFVLFDVSPLDPQTFATIVALVAIAALGAALVPAWRATRVDPAVALRAE